MTINWNLIENVNTKDFNDIQAEKVYEQLVQYNVTGTESIDQLKKLFECSKLVMQVKAIQADVAIEELEDILTKESLNSKKLKTNFNDDKNLIEVKDEKIEELIKSNDNLNKQVNEKDSEINKLKQNYKILEENLKTKEIELNNYSLELNQLKDEISLEKEQMNKQISENHVSFDRFREMNKKFELLLQEMNDMEIMNTQLGTKVFNLNEELNSATNQMKTATKEIKYLKKTLANIQEMNDLLIKEKEDLIKTNQKLKSVLTNYDTKNEDENNKTTDEITNLIEQLKIKESELAELSLNQLDKNEVEKEKKNFLKEISKRDNQINLLKNQLSQAIDDIEAQTCVIENLIEKNIKKIYNTDNLENVGTTELTNERHIIDQLENELKEKDKDFIKLKNKTTLYEKGVYGLKEAIKDLENLEKLMKKKDEKIDELIKELNTTNIHLSNTQDELDYLKEFLNADEELKKKLNEDDNLKNDKLKILKFQKEILKLESEKIKLYEELTSYKLKKKLNQNNFDESLIKIKEKQSFEELKLHDSMSDLQKENQQLQLAMKEILLGLKESDSKSDVVIDCPSLERLCQFLESRSINSNLANVIALKAELDILRGHNEELRMTNKRLRNDVLKILENYSKTFLSDFYSNHNNYIRRQNPKKDLVENNDEDSELSEGEIVTDKKFINKLNKSIQTDLNDIILLNTTKELINSEKDNLDQDNEKIKNLNTKINKEVQTDFIYEYIANLEEINENNLTNENNCNQCETIKKLLIDFQEKIDKIDSSVIEREEDFNLRINVLKNENNNLNEDKRILEEKNSKIEKENKDLEKELKNLKKENKDLENDYRENKEEFKKIKDEYKKIFDEYKKIHDENENLQKQIKILKEDLKKFSTNEEKILKVKEKEIIDLVEKLNEFKNNNLGLENKLIEKKEIFDKLDCSDKTTQTEMIHYLEQQEFLNDKLEKINQSSSGNHQKCFTNILETIIKCLQATIQHKDDAIKHYQQILIKKQEDHQIEIEKIVKSYKGLTKNCIKNSKESLNDSQNLELTYCKYNDQLNDIKSYYQKLLIEQKKTNELQNCKIKRLRLEIERLKSQAFSNEEKIKLKKENEILSKQLEKNGRFIEKLKEAIQQERLINVNDSPKLTTEINDLKIKNESLNKVVVEKDNKIKELKIFKWNLEKKINELTEIHKADIILKNQQIEKTIDEKKKLKCLLEKIEKERNALRSKLNFKENATKVDKEIQTDEMNLDSSLALINKCKELDETISFLKIQLNTCAIREKELINLLKVKEFKNENEFSQLVLEKYKKNLTKKEPKKHKEILTKKELEKRKNSCDF